MRTYMQTSMNVTTVVKTLSAALSLTGLLAASQARADDPVEAPLVAVTVKNVFVPMGFDDNDESMAVVDGYLPNTCYRFSHNEAKLDQATKTFKITTYARKFPGLCMNLVVPFFADAKLGVLPAGNFKVQAQGPTVEELLVKEATSAGPDDFLYAPIDGARVEKSDDGQYTAVITGRFMNDCMAWDNVKVIDSGKTLEVLPIIKGGDSAACKPTENSFTYRVALPATMTEGRHLMHVRSLNGQAVNYVFTVDPAGN